MNAATTADDEYLNYSFKNLLGNSDIILPIINIANQIKNPVKLKIISFNTLERAPTLYNGKYTSKICKNHHKYDNLLIE